MKSSYDFEGIVRTDDVLEISKGVRELDLHGLMVWEAITVTELFLRQSKGFRDRLRIITGRGLNSPCGIPKIKPEIKRLLEEGNYKFREVCKGGCFEVSL